MTGFTNFEASIGGKWIELLRELAPGLAHAALMFNPRTAPFAEGFRGPAQAVAATFGATVVSAPVEDDAAIERAIAALGSRPGGALIGAIDTFMAERRELIIALAARHGVPAIYGNRVFTRGGGLMAFAADYPDLFRRAASYADRILKGAKPADLPVQPPAKFELSLNLKSARALGLEVPPALLARADEVIE
jgi:putative ABC transport system substrate-binding protein